MNKETKSSKSTQKVSKPEKEKTMSREDLLLRCVEEWYYIIRSESIKFYFKADATKTTKEYEKLRGIPISSYRDFTQVCSDLHKLLVRKKVVSYTPYLLKTMNYIVSSMKYLSHEKINLTFFKKQELLYNCMKENIKATYDLLKIPFVDVS